MGNTIQKWGFGMSPFKPETKRKYETAIKSVKAFIEGNGIVNETLLDNISTVKGLFNRTEKQDQWDWFTVYMYFDYPSHYDVITIVGALSKLRKSIISKDNDNGTISLNTLKNGRFLYYCDKFLTFNINEETPEEYLYILSRREDKEVLKIGMTTRNVMKRVNEINSATGVIYPFSARKIFKVKDSRRVETEVHHLLSEYRIRSDREFFQLEYSKACQIIDEYLTENDLYF